MGLQETDCVPISTVADAMHCTPKFPGTSDMKIWIPEALFSVFMSLVRDCTDWKCLCFVTEECCALVSSMKIWRHANSGENERRSCSFDKCGRFLICANIFIGSDWQMKSYSIYLNLVNFIPVKLCIINYPLHLLLTLQENKCWRSSGKNQWWLVPSIQEPG